MGSQKIKLLVAALVFGLSLLLSGGGTVLAQTRPYFKAYGADVFTGGGFNTGGTACDPSGVSYQAPNYSDLTGQYRGGIMGFALFDNNNQRARGAGSEFGALSLGLIEGNSDVNNPYGFSTSGTSKNKLSFASRSDAISASNYWGGFLEGTTRQTHCITDYFTTKQKSPSSINSNPINAASLTDGQYKYSSGGVVTVNGGQIAAARKVTLFVEGDVFISSSITYANHNIDNVPKFALVVKGNIYIGPDVSQLDGLYIAQPSTATAANGIIWTCHPNSTDPPTDVFVSSSACRKKLTVNGAFIAKKVNLVRSSGDVSSSTYDEASGSANIAEVFNFTPEMIVGGGFFNQENADANRLQSIISLPPVF